MTSSIQCREILTSITLLFFLGISFNSVAEPEFTLTIKDHKFQPAEITVPTGQKVKLHIQNQDPTAEEFESYSLHREKVIAGNSTGIVIIGPLDAGSYDFIGEFNEATAKGKIIAQ